MEIKHEVDSLATRAANTQDTNKEDCSVSLQLIRKRIKNWLCMDKISDSQTFEGST